MTRADQGKPKAVFMLPPPAGVPGRALAVAQRAEDDLQLTPRGSNVATSS
jgi:hypothetical protein